MKITAPHDPHPPTAATALIHPADLYARRRRELAAQLGPGGVAIVPTAPERPRNRDSDHPYRFDSYFFYLCGFTEPNALLLIAASGHTTLFCQPKNMDREIWDGVRLGPQAAPTALGVDAAYAIDDLNAQAPIALENQQTVWYPFAVHEGFETQLSGWLQTVRSKARAGVACPNTLKDVCLLLDEMRLTKDPFEQDTMRRAAQISALAHSRAMRTCGHLVRQGHDVREYHLDAELMHEFRRHGAQHVAYSSIVAAGANACILHYRADAAHVRAGDLVLIDAGCELDGYASDITRTFPANGTFSAAQKDLYQLVLNAQEAAVAATRAGARFDEPHQAVLAVLAQGLLDLRVLNPQTVGNAQDVLAQKAYTPFYMHRTSHWLGLDVHDCGNYKEPLVDGQNDAPAASRQLQAGMVLTIEPGLYIRPDPAVPEAFWNMGIRIEDDAIVTPHGCELISRGVPVKMDDIEQLMRD